MSGLRIKQTTHDGRTKIWKIDAKALQTFGSARKADIVSIDRLSPKYEAAIEHREDGWHFITFSGRDAQPDTKVTSTTEVKLSESVLRFILVEKEEFVQSSLEKVANTGTEKRKLLLVSKNGKLLKTEIQKPNYQFTYAINGETHKLPFAGSDQWQEHQIEGFQFKSKLILVEDLEKIGHVTSDQLVDKESKKMLYITLLSMFLLVFLGLVVPRSQKELAQQIATPAQSAVVKFEKKDRPKIKRGASAPKVAQQTPQQQPPQEVPAQAAAPAAATGGGKVNALLKGAIGARISQLIGKVSATEARTANVLVTQGRKAGEGESGAALAAVGKVNASGRNWNGESVGTASGVSTGGIGGGKGAAGLGQGLAAGKTGSGGVGLIEEESEVEGGLDREVIAQYIKTQLGQILYCYERQLSANPDLYGKVAVKFTISGTGQVDSQAIGDSTLKSQPVEGCILNKISKWKFPEPKGGTKVVVTYPFLFKSTN